MISTILVYAILKLKGGLSNYQLTRGEEYGQRKPRIPKQTTR